jgi:beta-lactamase superfamily II metal-dependent hydrolase
MITVYVPDVGDGLAAGVRTLDQTSIEIDCGSQNDAETAFHKGVYRIEPDVFFLSHFHADHYNGLLHANRPPPYPWLAIRQAFYPRIPVFRQRETFLRCMLAMDHWLMGDTSGSMAADFLSVLSGINRTSFTYRSLCMGDTVSIGGSLYEVLWPPRELDDDATLKVIGTAISDFNAAAEEHDSLRRILESIGERGQMRPYMGEDEETGELPGCGENAEPRRHGPHVYKGEDLPEPIGKANESLRNAANHLSLAFHEDNKLLFMGDLEQHEIRDVVGMLADKKRDHFFAMITPHHGTHWHNALRDIRTSCTISSVGSGLFRYVSAEYKSISDICLITHLNGDIEVPGLFAPWYAPRPWRYSRTFL